MKKTIAILGAGGNMGSNIAKNLARAGYRLLLADRDVSKLSETLKAIKATTPKANVELIDCAREADIIIPAVSYLAQAEVAQKINDVVTGKIIISIANPLNETFDGLLTEPTTSAAEELAKLLPHSNIVKAFNTTFAADFTSPRLGGATIDCFVAGADHEAAEAVSELVRDAGFNPIIAGKLSVSRTLEQMALLLVSLTQRYNYNWLVGWKVLHQAA